MERNKQGRLESRHLKSFPRKVGTFYSFSAKPENKSREINSPFFLERIKWKEKREGVCCRKSQRPPNAFFRQAAREASNFCLPCSKLNLFAQHVRHLPQLDSFRSSLERWSTRLLIVLEEYWGASKCNFEWRCGVNESCCTYLEL